MEAADAAGQRLIAAGQFLWFADLAKILHERLGADARKVPNHGVPNMIVRMLARFDPEIRSVASELGRKTTYSLQNAERRTGWSPRPIEETVVDCARSLLGQPPPTPRASTA
jgi:nucleoside-diphosphate-sugar epimerase